MRALLLVTVACVGCGANNSATNDDVLNGHPDDDVICVGDPDSNVICKRESEFWDCSVLPNGEVKCRHTETQTPGGGASWDCVQSGTKIICTSNDSGASGSGNWRCITEGGTTTCEKDAPVPPGGSSWNCVLDGEFHWICSGDTEPPSTPPPTSPPVPPGGGVFGCYETEPGSSAPTLPPGVPWATVLTEKVMYRGEVAVHVRVTFNKIFVDNTYGANSSDYLTKKGGVKRHNFADLVESDKAEIFFADAKGNLAMHMAVDYISPSPSAPSGYACLGVTGGDGGMILGNASDVLAARSSLAVNFNDLGYVLTEDSPVTDDKYTADPKYPKWIFEVWYEVWVKWSAFGVGGPSKAYITGIHASPSRLGVNTIPVVPGECL